jgi:hypothetical protein
MCGHADVSGDADVRSDSLLRWRSDMRRCGHLCGTTNMHRRTVVSGYANVQQCHVRRARDVSRDRFVRWHDDLSGNVYVSQFRNMYWMGNVSGRSELFGCRHVLPDLDLRSG